MKKIAYLITLLGWTAWAQPSESDYYAITTVPVPEGIQLEGGGIEVLPDGSVGVATRRGDIWIVENPSMRGDKRPHFRRFASGLHEPLGLAYLDGDLYTAQRGELTRLVDEDGDRRADRYETVYAWPLSAHYHEYSFGPVITADTSFFVTGNVAFGNFEWWRGESRVPWRGWAMKISKDGTMEPWATGMRSPAGIGLIDEKLFYTDNQGDWVGSGALWYVPRGAFIGHPAGLRWTSMEGSPVQITEAELYAVADKRQEMKNGAYIKPENIQNEENPDFVYTMKEKFPEFQLPAVILPHGILGISNSEVKVDRTGGKFGPFEGQVFIGDQGQSKIMRVYLEEIGGQYQGAAFDFRKGFQSGVLRMDWDSDGRFFIGETNRGWGSAGTKNSGLEFVTWTGEIPFEMKAVRAKPDGFEIEFTAPVDRSTATNLDSYSAQSFTYKYHPVYGSPQTNIRTIQVKGVQVSQDGMRVRLVMDQLRRYYVHEIHVDGLRQAETGYPVLHPATYYTLNVIPEGNKLKPSEYSTAKTTRPKQQARPAVKAITSTQVLSDEDVQPLLQKNTCIACHHKTQRLVGPSFTAIAGRKYTADEMVDLIYNPQPKNWPEYATPMAPMPQVPREEALQIAHWINSLGEEKP